MVSLCGEIVANIALTFDIPIIFTVSLLNKKKIAFLKCTEKKLSTSLYFLLAYELCMYSSTVVKKSFFITVWQQTYMNFYYRISH